MPSLVTSVIGGFQGASAAKDASKIQKQGAIDAGNKVDAAVTAVNPGIVAAGDTAATNINGAALSAGSGSTAAAATASGLLDPYRATGDQSTAILRDGTVAGGDFNRTFTADDFKTLDPGFDFRISEAQKALAKSASAHGSLLTGGALKQLDRYSQDYASSEFDKAFQRFETNTNDRFGRLNALSNSGQVAATQSGADTMHGADYSGDKLFNGQALASGYQLNQTNRAADNTLKGAEIGADYLTQGANADAAGHLRSAQAWNGMLNGVGDAGDLLLTGGASGFVNPFSKKSTGTGNMNTSGGGSRS